MVIANATTNGTARETGQYMRAMVDRFYMDMAPYAHLPLSQIFGIIKNIPFRPDPPDNETVQRPLYTVQQQGYGGDCDDKCIALAAWAKLNSMPYRFVAVRRPDRPRLHHVFCELWIDGRWIHADPTYRFNTLGREREQYAEYVVI